MKRRHLYFFSGLLAGSVLMSVGFYLRMEDYRKEQSLKQQLHDKIIATQARIDERRLMEEEIPNPESEEPQPQNQSLKI